MSCSARSSDSFDIEPTMVVTQPTIDETADPVPQITSEGLEQDEVSERKVMPERQSNDSRQGGTFRFYTGNSIILDPAVETVDYAASWQLYPEIYAGLMKNVDDRGAH